MSYIKGPIAFDGISFTLKDGSHELIKPEAHIKREIEEFLNCNPSEFTGIERIPFKSILDDLLAFAKKKADEEKKYFTPTIEDLHVGYECEVLPINESLGWEAGKLSYYSGYEGPGLYNLYPFWYTTRKSNYGRIKIMIHDFKQIRVPYLTSEQIEKEGWKYEPPIGLVIVHKFTKGDYILNWCWNDKKIFIYKMKELWPGSVNYELEPLYKGICPSINEFRTIMKLLNIK